MTTDLFWLFQTNPFKSFCAGRAEQSWNTALNLSLSTCTKFKFFFFVLFFPLGKNQIKSETFVVMTTWFVIVDWAVGENCGKMWRCHPIRSQGVCLLWLGVLFALGLTSLRSITARLIFSQLHELSNNIKSQYLCRTSDKSVNLCKYIVPLDSHKQEIIH